MAGKAYVTARRILRASARLGGGPRAAVAIRAIGHSGALGHCARILWAGTIWWSDEPHVSAQTLVNLRGDAHLPTGTKPKRLSASPSAKSTRRKPVSTNRRKSKSKIASTSRKVTLLAGGNPQIAKGDGNAPVQAYLAALSGWKQELGARVDALITRTVPKVAKAVKWNSPFYGIEGQGWFLSIHVFTRYLKIAFFRGVELEPLPPKPSKHRDVRYLDIYEQDVLDEKKLASWIKQAAALPGWSPGGPSN